MVTPDLCSSQLQQAVLKTLHALSCEPHFAILLKDQDGKAGNSLLSSLLELMKKSGGAAIRLIAGTLANAASASPEFCNTLSTFYVDDSYYRQFGRVLGTDVEDEIAGTDPSQSTFAASLARAFAGFSPAACTASQDAEIHVNWAVVGLLLAWLAQGSPHASGVLDQHVGSQSLIDLLRTFTIFQDHCGVLTDTSLICMHKVITSLTNPLLPDFRPASR